MDRADALTFAVVGLLVGIGFSVVQIVQERYWRPWLRKREQIDKGTDRSDEQSG